MLHRSVIKRYFTNRTRIDNIEWPTFRNWGYRHIDDLRIVELPTCGDFSHFLPKAIPLDKVVIPDHAKILLNNKYNLSFFEEGNFEDFTKEDTSVKLFAKCLRMMSIEPFNERFVDDMAISLIELLLENPKNYTKPEVDLSISIGQRNIRGYLDRAAFAFDNPQKIILEIYEHKKSPDASGYVDDGKIQIKGYQYAVCMRNHNRFKRNDYVENICVSIRGHFLALSHLLVPVTSLESVKKGFQPFEDSLWKSFSDVSIGFNLYKPYEREIAFKSLISSVQYIRDIM